MYYVQVLRIRLLRVNVMKYKDSIRVFLARSTKAWKPAGL